MDGLCVEVCRRHCVFWGQDPLHESQGKLLSCPKAALFSPRQRRPSKSGLSYCTGILSCLFLPTTLEHPLKKYIFCEMITSLSSKWKALQKMKERESDFNHHPINFPHFENFSSVESAGFDELFSIKSMHNGAEFQAGDQSSQLSMVEDIS